MFCVKNRAWIKSKIEPKSYDFPDLKRLTND